ncbi:type II toxin-antitoxin system VapC family toxin [Paracoccus aminophilus]|uniref:Toxin of a toxin/antitoxin system n=1 Tax=Paracoccus aminophilus JCM 7686 TaxID=1367847 RepID=S5Z0V7_PARAH|nr:type II toxin-antitoxin system VapC family toxin [Paracoccus aminophilus]AGT11051.1 toxin of a toxin/antitoxin system [Paracoccus aminophilus JCM 7686]
MNLLIDTHLLLWSAFAPEKIPARATALMLDPGNQLWFSAASIWEVAIKRGLNRPDFRVEPGVLRAGLLANDYSELSVDGRHCLGLAALPAVHADPFDRMLIAQAVSEGMVLLTADSRIGQYAGPIELV